MKLKVFLAVIMCFPLMLSAQKKSPESKNIKTEYALQKKPKDVNRTLSNKSILKSIRELIIMFEDNLIALDKDQDAKELILAERHLFKFLNADKDGNLFRDNDSTLLEKYYKAKKEKENYLISLHDTYLFLINTRDN